MAVITPSSAQEADRHEASVEPRDVPAMVAVDSALTAALAAYTAPGQRLAAALSGGMDSIVLLAALHALAPRFALSLSALRQPSVVAARRPLGRVCAAACAARTCR
jgi:hypothetical protein